LGAPTFFGTALRPVQRQSVRHRFPRLEHDTGDFTAYGDSANNGYDGIGNLVDGTLVGVDGNNNFL
jgi:hypothetical protein